MAPSSDAFSISRFTWIELSTSLDDARNDLPYAPYIMYIIERVSGIEFKKDVEHGPYRLAQWQHTGWEALVGAAGTSAAAGAAPLERPCIRRPSSSHHRSRGASSRSCSRTYFVCVNMLWMPLMREGRTSMT